MSSGNVSERMAISLDGGGQGTCGVGEHVAAALASVESDGCAQTFGAGSGLVIATLPSIKILISKARLNGVYVLEEFARV